MEWWGCWVPRKGPQGVHYFDRASGLNVLLDETTPPEEEWSAAPRTLSVALANACDCSCPHCFAPKTPTALNLEDVVGWAEELDRHGGQSIGFGGGEPTLVSGLPTLCREITNRTRAAVTITTHGLNVTADLADRLAGNVHFIRISVAGIEATYDAVLGRPFSRLLESLPAIRSIAPVGFNCLVTGATLDSLDETAEFACASGAQEILLLPEVAPDGRIRLDDDQIRQLSSWIDSRSADYPLALSSHASETISVESLPVDDPRGPSHDFLHLDSAGTLKQTAFHHAGVPVPPDGFIAAVLQLRQSISNSIKEAS
jgi:MoaA/NifB/PqqE/SkfB family radical SAM enzyme